MNDKEHSLYRRRRRQLLTCIEHSKGSIAADGLKEVERFFNHSEDEIAFEGLLIELIEAKKYPRHFDFDEWRTLALGYELDREFVFRSGIWKQFLIWGAAFEEIGKS